MTELDLNNLRPLLDEHEAYARAIRSGDARAAIAKDMLAVIAEARENLRPSGDSTANYIEVKRIIERLGTLRQQAAKTA